ncbi:MAG: sulfate adenylyltransferase subunit CysD [bacterium]
MEQYRISNLKYLEAESIHILREVIAEFENPVMLYSVGKDSSVMIRLAQKAFFPGKLPFPLLHVDTTYKFPEMYEFRDKFCSDISADLRVFTSADAAEKKINPQNSGTIKCCFHLKTQALLDALRQGEYDAAFGGGRRDEEKSRAKERVFSFRDEHGQWDPKNQRPELWNLYNSRINRDKGENIRVFPLSNWTELDIWNYIKLEDIPINPLYYASERDVILRNGLLLPYYEGLSLVNENETQQKISCRFRTLGCLHCTAAIESTAVTLDEIIQEMMLVRRSERVTRIIDHDQDGSMELKKKEGYF